MRINRRGLRAAVVNLVVALAVGASTSPASAVGSTAALGGSGVFAWGGNEFGELGDGTNTGRVLPVEVIGLPGPVRQVAAGGYHTMALLDDGRVFEWGVIGCKTIGTPFVSTNKPTEVLLPGPAQEISVGWGHSAVLLQDGTVWTLGCNDYGQLGDGTKTHSKVAVKVKGLNGGVTSVAVGSTFTLAARSGDVYAWGSNKHGQMGQLPLNVDFIHPRNVPGLHDVTKVAAGSYHGMALRGNSSKDPFTVWTWGSNTHRQLGDPLDGQKLRTEPRIVSGLVHLQVTAISAGSNHSLALASPPPDSELPSGVVMAWGASDLGQLGDGFCLATPSPNPVQVINLPPIAQISAGGNHNVVLDVYGDVHTWGQNKYGQLGYPSSFSCHDIARQVAGLGTAISVSGGSFHSVVATGVTPRSAQDR